MVKKNHKYQLEHERHIDNKTIDIVGKNQSLYEPVKKDIVRKVNDLFDGNPSLKISQNEIVQYKNNLEYIIDQTLLSNNGRKRLESIYDNKINNRLELVNSEVEVDLVNLGMNEESNLNEWLEKGFKGKYEVEASRYKLNNVPTKEIDNIFTQSVRRDYYGKNYSERLWGRNDNLRNWVKSNLYEYAVRGKDPKKLVNELVDMFDVTSFEAERLAITEYGNIQSQATTEVFKRKGITEYEVIPESGACELCMKVANNGPYKVEDRQVGVNAEMLHPYCRCLSVGIT